MILWNTGSKCGDQMQQPQKVKVDIEFAALIVPLWHNSVFSEGHGQDVLVETHQL